MSGHHLILGQMEDILTGDVIDDTHDERYRQKVAKLLIKDKGYDKSEVVPRNELIVWANDQQGKVWVDFKIVLGGRIGMIIRYGPGSLVTRHRPVLAMSRLLAPYQIPVAAVTNGESADILDGSTCRIRSSGLENLPDRSELERIMADASFSEITETRKEMESRIVFAYEIDGSCPCDTTVCRLPAE